MTLSVLYFHYVANMYSNGKSRLLTVMLSRLASTADSHVVSAPSSCSIYLHVFTRLMSSSGYLSEVIVVV